MNIIGIYPGSFQPPSAGNYKAYEMLKKHTGENTFVTTNDVVNLPNAPLTFQDKQQIWTRHGVPIDKIVMSKDPTKAGEVLQKFGVDRTVVIFAMPKKDAVLALRDPSGRFAPFQGLTSQMEPMNSKAYILTIPDEVLYVNKQITSDTVRKAFGSKNLPEEKKKSFFKQMFGWYDISLFDLIKKKFAEAGTVKERMTESVGLPIIRRTLKTFVKEVLGELLSATPQGEVPPTLSTEPAMTPGEIEKQKRDAKHQKDQALKQKEAELQTAKKEKEFQKQRTGQIDKYTIPNTTKDIQRLKGAKI